MRTAEKAGSFNESTILYGLLFLFFFQLLYDFVESIYAFGLLGTSIPPEIASVLLLFTPLLLLLAPGYSWKLLSKRQGPVLLGGLFLLARLVEPALDTRGRMLVSGLGVGLFLIIFPVLLRWELSRKNNPASALTLGAGLALGLSLSILARTLLSGLDITTDRSFLAVGWTLALAAGILLYRKWAQDRKESSSTSSLDDTPAAQLRETRLQNTATATPHALGITSVFILIYFAFASPNVIARWTGASYLQVVFLLLLALVFFARLLAARPHSLSDPPTNVVWIGNILFVLTLTLTILMRQVRFPADQARYPFYEPAAPALGFSLLVFMLLLSPVILLDFILLTRSLLDRRPSLRALGAGFSLSSLYLLVMIFAQVFTTVYDYIPVVGPLFRDRFWLVYLLPGAVLILTLYLTEEGRALRMTGQVKVGSAFPALVILIAAASVAGLLLTSSTPAPQAEGTGLRVLTYNIQQGYSADGSKNYAGQLELLRQVDADLIGLQESDTNRIAGGNSDIVRYFADRLNLYTYYGPSTVTGTFGIALLSRYPILNPRTFYMYSAGEQTAAIAAEVAAGGRTFNVFVTHLGNGGPLIQQQQFLTEVQRRTDVIAMGDFNFEPGTEQYHLTTELLADSWLLRWPDGVDNKGFDPADRIDHIFLSPGMTVSDARYLTGPESDHPAHYVDIDW